MSKKIMIVGNISRAAVERTGKEDKKFLAFGVAVTVYNRDSKQNETKFYDATLNRYGAGLVAKLEKGAQVAIVGLPGTREHEGKTYDTVMVDALSIGNALFYTFDGDEGKTMAGVVGRLGRDAAEREHEGKKFLSLSIATEVYNKDSKTNETLWIDATINRFGAGLPAKLVKGTNVALEGLFVAAEGDKNAKLYVNELRFMGGKREDAPASTEQEEI